MKSIASQERVIASSYISTLTCHFPGIHFGIPKSLKHMDPNLYMHVHAEQLHNYA